MKYLKSAKQYVSNLAEFIISMPDGLILFFAYVVPPIVVSLLFMHYLFHWI